MTLASLCFTMQASAAYYGDNCCAPVQCCETQCCEDGPLRCNAFGAQLKGGVTPSYFTDRGNVWIYNPSLSDPLYEGNKGPEFDKLFELPWQIGAELAWNASTHVQFFGEYVYESAKGKKRNFLVNNDQYDIRQNHGEFKTNAFYIGARYFFGNLWCSECGTSSVAPFVGFKAGAKWHERSKFHQHVFISDIDYDLGSHDFFKEQTLMSAGVQIGLDYSINCNFGVVFTVEAVGTQGLRNNRNVPLAFPIIPGRAGTPTNISLGETGHIVSVPITLGVRYTF